MMYPELYKLKGEKRESGKKNTRQLRDELKVPAVLYGPEVKENVHFSISEIELEKILSVGQTKLQELTVGKKTFKTLLMNVEYDPVTDRTLHADFYVLADKHPVTLQVPIRVTGTPQGVTEGGRLIQPLRIVRIRVLPDKIPAVFAVDVSHLDIGDSIHVEDLEMEGIIPLDDPKRTIVTIAAPKSEALFTTPEIEEEAELEGELAEGEEEAAEGEGEAPAEGEKAAEDSAEEAKE